MSDINIDPRVTEFLEHLESGLAQAGLDFENYNPTYVHLRDENTNELTTGCIFSQVINPTDTEHTVCVAYDGVSFPQNKHSKIPFKFDQPPSMVAILFLVAMMKELVLDPPSCPHCEEKEKS